MTPADLITLALKQAGATGVGQAPLPEDLNDAFTLLNMMIGQWNKKRWLIYHLVDVSLVSTGAQSYTIGIGGQFNVTRPDRLEAAYVRLLSQAPPNQVDYPLAVLQSREDYSRITMKSILGWPSAVFYDPTYPLGTLYFWRVPASGTYEMHVVLKETLAAFSALNQTINLPTEYQEAIFYNLAMRLRAAYQMAPDPTIMAMARASLATLQGANAAIPVLGMPDGLAALRNYNVYSDQSY